MRALGAIVLISLLALGIYASEANAEPLSMVFTEDRANVGVQLSDEAMFTAPDRAPFAAQIDPGSGSITNGVLGVPAFSTHITDPIDADVTVDFDIGQITGNFDPATGALTLSGTAAGTLTSEGEECTVATDPAVLTLSTSTPASTEGSPRSGAPFTGGLAGAGAIAGAWDDMHAEPVDPEDSDNVWFCGHVYDQVGGPGGIWLEQEDAVAPSAPLLLGTDPSSPGLSDAPRILGAAEAASTVRVYAGPDCAGSPVAGGGAAQLGSPGISVQVAEGVTAVFSATATDTAGNTSTCSAPISYTHAKAAAAFPRPASACIVPKLTGKTLGRAKAMLKAAGCKLGEVRRPMRPKGKRRRALVVKSSSPRRGAKPADGKVHLTLGPRHRKARH
jgi:hypothetical protein